MLAKEFRRTGGRHIRYRGMGAMMSRSRSTVPPSMSAQRNIGVEPSSRIAQQRVYLRGLDDVAPEKYDSCRADSSEHGPQAGRDRHARRSP